VHEIKHDGYRLMARRDPVGIRLLARNGYDWAPRYPLITDAVNALKVRSCLIDGEAVACDDNGLAVFERPRQKRAGRHVFLYAFDLLELNGKDLRREPFEVRKAMLASLLRSSLFGVRLNEQRRLLKSHPRFRLSLAHPPQSPSAFRFTGGASGFLNLSQFLHLPLR